MTLSVEATLIAVALLLYPVVWILGYCSGIEAAEEG